MVMRLTDDDSLSAIIYREHIDLMYSVTLIQQLSAARNNTIVQNI